MYILKHYIVTLIFFFNSTLVSGQSNLSKEWQKQLSYINTKYSELPKQKLDSITLQLDSTVIANHCYKFITNFEKSKLLAFYIVDRDGVEFKSINRKHGGTYRSSTWGKKDDQIEAFAYTVSGIFYNGRWYYTTNEYVEFYANNLEEAKHIFLIRDLNERDFFVRETTKESKNFWSYREFAKNTYPYKKDYPNTPEVVARATIKENVIEDYKRNEKLEELACNVSNGIWSHLRELDSLRYHQRYLGKFMDDYCLSLYNPERDIVLLPMIYHDLTNQAHLKYYILKLTSTDSTLYTLKKIEEKEIRREKDDGGLEVVYDIGNFIKNWSWGTVNMISNRFFGKIISLPKILTKVRISISGDRFNA